MVDCGDHLRSTVGIICGPFKILGSFGVLYKFELTLSRMGQTIGKVMVVMVNFREHFPYFFS